MFQKEYGMIFIKKTGIQVTLQDVIIGSESCDLNTVITLLSYEIFKVWCRETFDNIVRHSPGSLKDVELSIKSRTTAYNFNGKSKINNFILEKIYQ